MRDLSSYLALIDSMPPEQHEYMLSLYLVFGEDAFFILYLFRGQLIKFPSKKMFGKVARLLDNKCTKVVTRAVIRNGILTDVVDLKKNDPVLFEKKEWIVLIDPVKMADIYFAVLYKEEPL